MVSYLFGSMDFLKRRNRKKKKLMMGIKAIKENHPERFTSCNLLICKVQNGQTITARTKTRTRIAMIGFSISLINRAAMEEKL